MKIPQLTWSQNQKYIYLNILLEPLDDYILDINENNIKFKQEDYEIDLELNNTIDIKKYKINKNRIFEIDLHKKEHKFWTDLLKDPKLYKNNISINWTRWIDEDDDDDIFNANNDYSDEEINDSSDEEINDISDEEINDTSDEEINDTIDKDILENTSSDDDI